jgi:hypothetical protein
MVSYMGKTTHHSEGLTRQYLGFFEVIENQNTATTAHL